MNKCITHYDSLSCYGDPVFVTKRTLKTVLLAIEELEKRNDRHIFQCKLAPKESILRNSYNRNPCYSKFTKIICQKQSGSVDKSIQNFNSINKKSKFASTRTTK